MPMTYYFATTLAGADMAAVEECVREELSNEGFGVLTEIDVAATLKKKIGADFRPYRILGACNPTLAHEALQAEDKIGVMLPCNVILQEKDGGVEVAAVDPVASMQAVDNDSLGPVASKVRGKLQLVIERVSRRCGA
ncbi:DUF302 domain-containing protein [Sphingomicrobium aestuariivivum]|uniref:DUF302 domain-containing protein n=1 Tax=Sphingomicrobium aestuariivivum TaxID=1582356 RepID=UPI001FD68FFF|nr:DUF302 domain-containing protein [Sphingomicrobium aestuariivivum]MCJ8190347.1 DUF302 domain-containing protein [Sphingomicrobium aestuariivivum]